MGYGEPEAGRTGRGKLHCGGLPSRPIVPPLMDAPRSSADSTDAGLVAHGREILRAEGEAILQSADSLDAAFARAVRIVAD